MDNEQWRTNNNTAMVVTNLMTSFGFCFVWQQAELLVRLHSLPNPAYQPALRWASGYQQRLKIYLQKLHKILRTVSILLKLPVIIKMI